MNRSMNAGRDSFAGLGTTIPARSHHNRRRSLPGSAEDNLDLFSRSRRGLSLPSSDESHVKAREVAVGPGSANVSYSRSGKVDDLLLSSDGGKNDYDWLLTPPGTPVFPSSDGSESQPTLAASKSRSTARSVSNTNSSKLSVARSESNHSSRPNRGSSVTRPSISATQYNSYSSTKSTSILNTSSASVSSYIRPSSSRTPSPSTARFSNPSVRPATAQPSTYKARPASPSPSSANDRMRPTQISRPSSPSARRQVQSNINSPNIRSTSRPSTPPRRNSAPFLSAAASLSLSVGQVVPAGRNSTPTLRPSSPRVRSSQQPVVPPDFPVDTPPNLRTTLASRPLSAGRSRPGVSVNAKANSENTAGPNKLERRHSSPSPNVTRGRLVEPAARVRVHGMGHVELPESRKVSNVSELPVRKPVKAASTNTESTGFGRTISKKSLDMAIRHMDIKGSPGVRSISGISLFPQSIRSVTPKTRAIHAVSDSASRNFNSSLVVNNGGVISENGNYVNGSSESGTEGDSGRFSAKLSDVDFFPSARYETNLLNEDLKNAYWLHGVDDKSDQGSIFDNGFELLPEPFG